MNKAATCIESMHIHGEHDNKQGMHAKGACHRMPSRRIAIIVALVALALLLAAGAVFAALPQQIARDDSAFYDAGASIGSYDGKSEDEIRAALDEKVAQGMFNISIASVIRFPNGSQNDGVANITNIAQNRYDMSVEITLDENGKCLYRSGAIEPGCYIESINLLEALDAGEYDATAMFTAYERNEQHTVQGHSGAKVRIVVY